MLTEIEAARALRELSASGPLTEGDAAHFLRRLADDRHSARRGTSAVLTRRLADGVGSGVR